MLCCLLVIPAITGAYAQPRIIHEVSASLGGGMSTLNYKPEAGNKKYGFGGEIGVGYRYFFKKEWAINTGLGFELHNSKMTVGEIYSVIPGLYDNDFFNMQYDLHSTVNDYTEKQRMGMITLPVQIHFERGHNKRKYYVAGGFKFGLPVFANYRSSSKSITNKGYYPDLDNWLETQEFMGFGTFTGVKDKNKLSFKPSVMLSLEAGLKWKLPKISWLYTGVYFDYGLNNISKGDKTNDFLWINVSDPSKFKTRSVLESSYTTENGQKVIFADRVVPMTVGIKLTFNFIEIDNMQGRSRWELFESIKRGDAGTEK